MRSLIRVAIDKNGRHLATIGCVDRGILSVGVKVGEQAGVLASAIEVPGGARPDETVGWSFGHVKVGDVITLRLLERGRLTRPDTRVRETENQRLASAKRALRIGRKRRAERISTLEQLLKSGLPQVTPAPRLAAPALRIWAGDQALCTAGARGAFSLRLSLGAILRPGERSPSFDARATALTNRQMVSWDFGKRLGLGAAVRVEVIAAGRATPAQGRSRRRAEPSTRAQVLREIERIKKSGLLQANYVRELERNIRRTG